MEELYFREMSLDDNGQEYEEITEIIEYSNGKVFRVITDTKGKKEKTEITKHVKK